MTSELTIVGSHEIRFRGDEVCEVADSLDMTEWDERQLNLQLFSSDQGGFVAAIEFSSSNSSIATAREAEHLDTLEDVEKFFFVFDPLEHVSITRRKDVSSPSVHARRHLSDLYRKLVDELLLKATEHRDMHPECERVAATLPKDVNRIWKFFGLA